jgi:uncharacterized protein (DUF3084 family)
MNGYKKVVSATARPNKTRHLKGSSCKAGGVRRRVDLPCGKEQFQAKQLQISVPSEPEDQRLASHNRPYRMLNVIVGVEFSGRGFLGLSQNGVSAHA